MNRILAGVTATILAALLIVFAVPASTNDAHLRGHGSFTIYDMYRIAGIHWEYSDTPCGVPESDIGGCFNGRTVYISTDAQQSPGFTTFALWHEYHHWLDQVNGVPYTGIENECAADYFAYVHDAAAWGTHWGYGCWTYETWQISQK